MKLVIWFLLASARFLGGHAACCACAPGVADSPQSVGGPPDGQPVVLTIRQLNLSCPEARESPGKDGTRQLCEGLEAASLFTCGTSWSAGASGVAAGDLKAISDFALTPMQELCGGCAGTLSYSTFLDAAVEMV